MQTYFKFKDGFHPEVLNHVNVSGQSGTKVLCHKHPMSVDVHSLLVQWCWDYNIVQQGSGGSITN